MELMCGVPRFPLGTTAAIELIATTDREPAQNHTRAAGAQLPDLTVTSVSVSTGYDADSIVTAFRSTRPVGDEPGHYARKCRTTPLHDAD